MRQPYPTLIGLILAASSCTDPARPIAEIAPAEVLTPTQLIATVQEHQGQTVTLSGYFTYVVDTRALWEHEAAYRDAEQLRKGSWDKCVTIYLSKGDARRFSGHRVRVTGKAIVIGDEDIRSLWTCNPVAIEEAVVTLE